MAQVEQQQIGNSINLKSTERGIRSTTKPARTGFMNWAYLISGLAMLATWIGLTIFYDSTYLKETLISSAIIAGLLLLSAPEQAQYKKLKSQK